MTNSQTSGGASHDIETCNKYLGVFNWLCIGLFIGCIFVLQKVSCPFFLLSFGLLGLILIIVILFKAQEFPPTLVHFLTKHDSIDISLQQKKQALFMALVLFLIDVNIVTILTGGSNNSPFIDLLGITGGIGALLADKKRARLGIISITLSAYIIASLFYYDLMTKSIKFHMPEELVNLILKLGIIFILLVTSAFATKTRVGDKN